MNETNERKVLLSLKNVEVKFNVRGRILTAIRRVSLDIYENENIAIVGESGSGKSVLTKTFAGMLDSNGFISNGSIIFSDDEISKTDVKMTGLNKRRWNGYVNKLNKYSVLERGAKQFVAVKQKEQEIKALQTLTPDEEESYASRIKQVGDDAVDKNNFLQTLDRHAEEDKKLAEETSAEIKALNEQKEALIKEREDLIKRRAAVIQTKETIRLERNQPL